VSQITTSRGSDDVLDVVWVLVVLSPTSVEGEESFVVMLSEVLVLPQATSDRQIADVNSVEIAFLFILKFLLKIFSFCFAFLIYIYYHAK
jgi:hypothetical protein